MPTSNTMFNNQFAISQFDEYYLPCINRSTFEKVDSTTAFKKIFKQEIFKQDTLHIILGLDSGLLVNYILEAPKVDGSKYIFVELPEVMAMLNIDIPDEKKEYLKVISFDKLVDILPQANHNLFLFKNQVKVTLSISASAGIIEDYPATYNQICQLLSQTSSSLRSNLNQKLFFIEQLYNVVENRQPASVLRNKFLGKTCIVIGGGPSLDDHLEWIQTNYDDLFVIAVSRFASKLSLLGIPAHIIVSIDPQDHNFEVNRDMMTLSNESLLINSHHICHRILAQWQGRSLYLGEHLPWSPSDNIPTVGPTVTNSSIRIAIEMGFSQILLTGVDFCHSKSGVTHAKGSIEASAGSDNSIIHQWVETYAGHLAETPMALYHAANCLQHEAAEYPEVNIINLSINAAKIKGIKHLKVNDIDIQPVICSPITFLKALPECEANNVQFFYSLEKDLKTAKQAFSKMGTFSNEALKLLREAKELPSNTHQHQQKMAKIEEIESKLNKKYSSFCKLIKIYGYYEFSQFLNTKNTEDWSLEQMNSMTYKYYRAFEIISKEMSALIQNSLALLDARREELKSSPSVSLLAKVWQLNDQPGRVLLWLNKVKSQTTETFTEADKELINELEKDYQEQKSSTAHPYFSIKTNNQNLTNTLAKIIDLKSNKNISGLELLAKNIEPLFNKDPYAARLFHLTHHYIHFLNDDFESALNDLLNINKSSRTEIEYKQILLVAYKLHQLDLAEETLDELKSYSDEYIPQYAHILSLRGESQLALNEYLDYLDKYPNDESVLIKLAVFLANIGERESAISAFKQTLSINPDNLTALSYLGKIA
ncbi:DUF115 domain-containing protein [Shewanella electrodiphila]|uniref:DUF115 domain-containing protein n=1 Tax=Shewanella electrodiphila TaxID=934143 RepID=A0ABT0KLZ7_9GAMM|nr:6-hydroxymethylpterin diphosphokinase MptE-like protein [Shewanella electrodiphila]MCL1044794.1 DUF115 domain-containing protein [Shewanella electrodiphila]